MQKYHDVHSNKFNLSFKNAVQMAKRKSQSRKCYLNFCITREEIHVGNRQHLYRHLKRYTLVAGNRYATGSTMVLRKGVITWEEDEGLCG